MSTPIAQWLWDATQSNDLNRKNVFAAAAATNYIYTPPPDSVVMVKELRMMMAISGNIVPGSFGNGGALGNGLRLRVVNQPSNVTVWSLGSNSFLYQRDGQGSYAITRNEELLNIFCSGAGSFVATGRFMCGSLNLVGPSGQGLMLRGSNLSLTTPFQYLGIQVQDNMVALNPVPANQLCFLMIGELLGPDNNNYWGEV